MIFLFALIMQLLSAGEHPRGQELSNLNLAQQQNVEAVQLNGIVLQVNQDVVHVQPQQSRCDACLECTTYVLGLIWACITCPFMCLAACCNG